MGQGDPYSNLTKTWWLLYISTEEMTHLHCSMRYPVNKAQVNRHRAMHDMGNGKKANEKLSTVNFQERAVYVFFSEKSHKVDYSR